MFYTILMELEGGILKMETLVEFTTDYYYVCRNVVHFNSTSTKATKSYFRNAK